MSVAQMLAQMDSAELTEWQAYYGLEPFGQERADLRAGIISATVANAMTTREGRSFEPRDFMPVFDRQEREVNSAVMAGFNRARMAVVARRKKKAAKKETA
jgi:hypothetical protein